MFWEGSREITKNVALTKAGNDSFPTIIKYINSKSSNCQKYSLRTKHFSLARFEDEDVPIKNDSEIESNCATNTSFISLINLTIIYHTMPVDLCKCHQED